MRKLNREEEEEEKSRVSKKKRYIEIGKENGKLQCLKVEKKRSNKIGGKKK